MEPAKTEYRALLHDPAIGSRLRIFTLGDEQTAPFRLNPFEVMEGIPVSVHIDLLKSAFTASFGMWTPLPSHKRYKSTQRCSSHKVLARRAENDDPRGDSNVRMF